MDAMPPEEQAAENVRKVLLKSPGFADLAGFRLVPYTEEEVAELDESGKDWVGQYVAGSVDSELGITVFIRPEKHATIEEMMDTIGHELGHATWELLETESQMVWPGDQEEFADHLMHWLNGNQLLMDHAELFLRLTDANE
jgi:hypothetical protein